MNRIIYNQIITSTTLDLQGDKLTLEQLQSFLSQIPDNMLLNNTHDLSKPPVGRAFNKKLIALPAEEYAIQVDIEILDEAEFS